MDEVVAALKGAMAMRAKFWIMGGVILLAATVASAQGQSRTPLQNDLYCSGIVSDEAVPSQTIVITGDFANTLTTFGHGDYVYINKGASQGVKVGDEFIAVRQVKDENKTLWFSWEDSILNKIGKVWEDEGRVRVVVIQENTSTAQVVQSCSYLQRGDIILPVPDRPAPVLKPEETFDRFAPASGKALAMVVTGKEFHVSMGTNDIAYVNLGAAQGVKVGDYFRVFRYSGTQTELAYQVRRNAFQVYGFGAAPAKYKWDTVPRQVLGEGVVLRTAPNASTVMLTFTLSEIYAGDYVELE
jgi:hypothetical protein